MDLREGDELRAYLMDRDLPCPGCGYNLRGLPGRVCPECRQELRLTVGLAEPRIGALVACMAPLFAGVGAAGALLTVVGILIVMAGRGMPRGDEAIVLIWLPLGCIFTCGAAAAVWCSRQGRARFRRQSRGMRRWIVVGCIGLPASWFAAFLAMLLPQI